MSREITLQTEKTKLEQKFVKKMGRNSAEDFIQETESLDKKQLEAKLLDLAKTQQGIMNTRKADKTLNDLKDQVREQNKTYSEQLTANKDLTRFVSLIISEKFGDDLMDLQTKEDEE